MKNLGKIILGVAVFFPGISIFSGCSGNQKTKEPEAIKIGVVVSLTGNSGILGEYTLKGLQYVVDEQNAKGGLLGRKIELEIRDSKADPQEGVRVINEMMKQKHKPFMVYSIISGVSQAIKTETEANKIILMSAVGTDRFLEESKFTVRNFVAAATIGKEMTQFLLDTLHVSNLTIFYSDNEYGNSVKDAVIKNCSEKRIIVIAEPFDETASDFSGLIADKIKKGTECLYLTGIGSGLGRMFKQVKESGYTGKLIGDPLMDYPDVEKAAGSALKGIPYLDFAFNSKSKDSTTQAFVKGFENKFKTSPQNFSAITYDGVKLLFSVIAKAGTLNSEVLIKELNRIEDYKGVFGPVSVTDRNIKYRFVFKTWNQLNESALNLNPPNVMNQLQLKKTSTMETAKLENGARIPPLPMSEMRDEWIKTLEKLPGAGLKGAYTPVNVFGTLMYNPRTMGSFLEYWVTSKLEMGLSGREQELIILRMAYHYRCNYVWKHHIPPAKGFGVNDTEIAAVKTSQVPSVFSAREYALLMLTDEMVEQRTVRDEAWTKWNGDLKRSDLVDLVSIVSQYVFFSLLNNSIQIELEEPLKEIPGL